MVSGKKKNKKRRGKTRGRETLLFRGVSTLSFIKLAQPLPPRSTVTVRNKLAVAHDIQLDSWPPDMSQEKPSHGHPSGVHAQPLTGTLFVKLINDE